MYDGIADKERLAVLVWIMENCPPDTLRPIGLISSREIPQEDKGFVIKIMQLIREIGQLQRHFRRIVGSTIIQQVVLASSIRNHKLMLFSFVIQYWEVSEVLPGRKTDRVEQHPIHHFLYTTRRMPISTQVSDESSVIL